MQAPLDLAKIYGTTSKPSDNKTRCEVYQMENETGTGMITAYEVFPGISLSYNDIHMEYCGEAEAVEGRILEINHCREGRYECVVDHKNCYYMTPGALSIGLADLNRTESCFPLRHYHGITVYISIEQVTEHMREVFDLFSIQMDRIAELYGSRDKAVIIRGNESIEHIFSELYVLKEEQREGYLKLKVLELLLFIGNLEVAGQASGITYVNQMQVRQMKEIQRYITSHPQKHDTIEELARCFQMSPTALKSSFKKVYGTPIYAYMKQYRLQAAQKLLMDRANSVADVAAAVGYENPGKFSTAFKQEYGVSPMEYRKNVFLDR